MCTVCGNTSVTFDPFWDLSVPIPSRMDHVRLPDCFDLFTKEEVLDVDERPTCCVCQKRQKSVKYLSIHKFPHLLLVHLKRFPSQDQSEVKIDTCVNLMVNGLDLSPYSAEETPAQYSMYGVTNHSGTLTSGHYTALCKHPHTTEWHEYNDSLVHPVSQREVSSSKAYELFFELTGSPHD